jgi:hypothetical protein
MGTLLRGLATLAVIAGALVGLAAETTFVFAKLAESWTAMQTAHVARDTRRSMAQIKQEEVQIQTAEAAIEYQYQGSRGPAEGPAWLIEPSKFEQPAEFMRHVQAAAHYIAIIDGTERAH